MQSRDADPSGAELFGSFGVKAVANGYPAFPIPAGGKRTSWDNWTKWCGELPNDREVERWAGRYPTWSVAIACGQRIVAIDIDEDEEEAAARTEQLVFAVLGPTPLVRIGRAPRRILAYAVCGEPPATSRRGKTEVLGTGAYFVASGVHPDSKMFYRWPGSSPATMPIDQLPAVSKDEVDRLRRVLDASDDRRPDTSPVPSPPIGTNERLPFAVDLVKLGPWIIDERGMVVDGRDAFLAHLVWQAARRTKNVLSVARAAWTIFHEKADLRRPRRDGSRPWSHADAEIKAKALVRSGKACRKATTDASGEHGFWTAPTKHAFGLIVNAAGAAGVLSPSTVRVSHWMLSLVHGDGACFAAAATTAIDLGLSVSMVKKAKRKLRKTGFWTSHADRGGRGYIASYRPNPETLGFEFDVSRQTETVDTKGTMIFQGEGGNLWEDLLLEQKGETRGEEVESRGVSTKCRGSIGDMPSQQSPECR